ncbi:MAG: hypothetical protein EA398_06160 [Deltaproteobacteria bacterium]|nr:MAG: hypothetical protein EA398_06160 [Deltaproteobacteria bacterium]
MTLLFAACDTTAFIAPVNRPLTNVDTSGAVTDQACDAQRSDNVVRLRYVPLDPRRNVFVDGDRVGQGDQRETIVLGENFNWESLRFANARLFVSPDVNCASDADCAAAGFDGMRCLPVNPGEPAPGVPLACGIQAEASDGLPFAQVVPEFDGVEDADAQPQVILFGIFNGSTVHGFDPGSSAGGVVLEAVPDRSRYRVQMIQEGVRALLASGGADPPDANTPEPQLRNTYVRRSRICLASFRGEEFTQPNYFPNVDDCFFEFTDSTTSSASIRRFSQERYEPFNTLLTTPERGGRNVWYSARQMLDRVDRELQAVTNAIPSGAGIAAPQGHLVIFVDGPPDPQDAFQNPETAASVTVRAQELGVQIHVLHLDRPFAFGQPGAGRPYTGPVDEYANIACATGGSYSYTREPQSLNSQFIGVSRTMARAFISDLDLQTLLERQAVPPGRYTLAGQLSVTIGQSASQPLTLGGAVGGADDAGGQRLDRRLPVFKRPVGPPTVPGSQPTGEEPTAEPSEPGPPDSEPAEDPTEVEEMPGTESGPGGDSGEE